MTPSNEVKTRSFAEDVAATTGTNLLLAALGFLTGPFIARLLGVVGRGELAVIQVWPMQLAIFANLGMSEALVFFPAVDRPNAAPYVGTSVALSMIACVFYSAVGYFLMPYVLIGQSVEIIHAARIFLIIIPITALSGLPFQVFRGLEDYSAWNVSRIAPAAAWPLVLLIGAYIHTASPLWYASAYLISQMLWSVCLWVFLRIRITGSFCPSAKLIRPLLRFGIPSMSASGPNILAARLDQMILAAFAGPKVLGLYVVALGWGSATIPILGALASVTFPRVASSSAELRSRYFSQSVRISILAAVVSVIPVMIAAPKLIPLLFGRQFAVAVTTSLILTLYGALIGVRTVLEEGLRGAGHPGRILIAQAIGIPATAGLMAIFVPLWGLPGAGIGSLAGALITCLALFAIAKSILGVPYSDMCIPTEADVRKIVAHIRIIIDKKNKRMAPI